MKTLSVRRWIAFALLAIGALLTGGCAGVYTLAPVGEKPAALDPAQWEGTWLNQKNEPVQVKVTDRAKGELLVTSIEHHNGNTKTETLAVLVRQTGNRLFASVPETPTSRFGSDARDPNSKDVRHAWGLIKREDDLLIVWAPDPEKFKALIQAGKLKGREITGGDFIVEPLSDANIRALTSGEWGVPFMWDSPVVFRRNNRVSP